MKFEKIRAHRHLCVLRAMYQWRHLYKLKSHLTIKGEIYEYVIHIMYTIVCVCVINKSDSANSKIVL